MPKLRRPRGVDAGGDDTKAFQTEGAQGEQRGGSSTLQSTLPSSRASVKSTKRSKLWQHICLGFKTASRYTLIPNASLVDS
jgi:hypothetical protein